jgi:hypothetical protein
VVGLEALEPNTTLLRFLHQILVELHMTNTLLLRLNLGPRAPEEVVRSGLEELDKVRKKAAREAQKLFPLESEGEEKVNELFEQVRKLTETSPPYFA